MRFENIINRKIDLEDEGYVQVNNIFEEIAYFSKEKNFLVKNIKVGQDYV